MTKKEEKLRKELEEMQRGKETIKGELETKIFKYTKYTGQYPGEPDYTMLEFKDTARYVKEVLLDMWEEFPNSKSKRISEWLNKWRGN